MKLHLASHTEPLCVRLVFDNGYALSISGEDGNYVTVAIVDRDDGQLMRHAVEGTVLVQRVSAEELANTIWCVSSQSYNGHWPFPL